MIFLQLFAIHFVILATYFQSSDAHAYFVVANAQQDPKFFKMAEEALIKYKFPSPLKVLEVKNAFDDHNKGKKFHMVFIVGPSDCGKDCVPTKECNTHVMVSSDGGVAVQEVECKDLNPKLAEENHTTNNV